MNILAIDWQQGWELAGWTMCYFLVGGTLVALVAGAARYALRHTAHHVRYGVSLAGFAALALLPLGIAAWLTPTAAIPHREIFVTPDAAIATHNTVLRQNIPVVKPPYAPSEATIATVELLPQSRSATPDQHWWEQAVSLLPWVWIVGAPLTFALLATGLIGSGRLRRAATPVSSGAIADACQRLRASLGISRRVGVALCERIASPLLVGIVRPLILLPPAALGGWSPEQLEMVLLHELAHVRRLDNLVNLVQRLVESLLFFHPAVWLLSRQVRRDREECCDAVVVANTAKPQAYAELLVSLAAPTQPLAGLALARHPLSRRVRRILKLEDETMLVSRNTMGMVVLLFVAMLAVAVWQPLAQTVAEENAVVAVSSKEETTEDTEGTEQQASRVAPDPGKNSPFPTLEAQRDADVAYKLLGVELEQLDKEELARVKAMKFAGGLRVGTTVSSSGPSDRHIPLQPDDLLVGLHVWPTESLEQVRVILRRDDLAELSPLKFYVVRWYLYENSIGEYGGETEMVDRLVTGRIMVNIAATTEKSSINNTPRYSLPQAAQVLPNNTESLEPVRATSPFGNSAKPTLMVFCDPTKSEPCREMMRIVKEVSSKMKDKLVFVILDVGKNPKVAKSYQIKTVPTCLLFQNDKQTGTYIGAGTAAELENFITSTAKPTASVNPPVDKSTKSILLYDGKTFDQWRSQWKNELSIKHRTETVRAMAAFGNAGHGKEAAEVILEIAGQYDWNYLRDGLIKQLQTTCINAFGKKSIFGESVFGSFPNTLPRNEAKDALLAAMQSENVRVRAFMEYVLPNFESLLEIYQQQWEKDEELRKYWGPKRTVAPGLGLGGGGGSSTPP